MSSRPAAIVIGSGFGGLAAAIRLQARARHVSAERGMFHGRAVRVAGGRIAWAYAGDDGLADASRSLDGDVARARSLMRLAEEYETSNGPDLAGFLAPAGP